MKFVIDMNLSPRWVEVFMLAGLNGIHWSTLGDPRATDRSIMDWARSNAYIVFTHDLDFGAILAATQASGPSVIQIRGENVLPEDAGDAVIAAIRRFQDALELGALISVDPARARARILPLDKAIRRLSIADAPSRAFGRGSTSVTVISAISVPQRFGLRSCHSLSSAPGMRSMHLPSRNTAFIGSVTTAR